MKTNTAIILAGGKSSRMGFDKQLIKIDGKLIVDYISEKLKTQFEEIIVVTNKKELYNGKNYKFAQDEYLQMGPMAGIHAGLKKANSKAAFVTACDMPNVDLEFLEFTKNKFENLDTLGLIYSEGEFIEPMNGIYSKDLLAEIEKRLQNKDLKLRKLIEDSNFTFVEKDKLKEINNPKIFENINYKEDLEGIK